MNRIRLTRTLRRQIQTWAAAHCQGSQPLLEAGQRYVGEELSVNMRLWGETPWAGDLVKLQRLTEIELDDEGLCTLDLYATTGRREDRELERNVYVTVNASAVLKVSTNDFSPF